MNRMQLNRVIGKLIPASSETIGSPRRSANLLRYAELFPAFAKVQLVQVPGMHNEVDIPSFFKWKRNGVRPDFFVSELKQARVWGRNGCVVAHGDYFIADVSKEFNEDTGLHHSVFYTLMQVGATYLDGKTAVIGTAGASVYYHWMLDILPRITMIAQFVPVATIDRFITEFTGLPFQIETLERAGVPVEKVLPSNHNWQFHVKASELIVPSLAGVMGEPTLFQINVLRQLFREELSTATPVKRIYISRKQTGRRTIVNEDEVIALLTAYSFEVVYCENMSVAAQVKLFSESAFIICSHGSALTNLAFCNAGIKVIDIFNESHVNPCFWFIAQHLSLHYQFIAGKSIKIDDNPKSDNTLIGITDLKATIEQMELKTAFTQ